jgi:Sulfotransferase family
MEGVSAEMRFIATITCQFRRLLHNSPGSLVVSPLMPTFPILLFGMPRSGTSWIGKILDSHPDTLYRHEPDAGGALAALPLGAAPAEADRYREVVNGFVRRLPAMRSAKVASTLPLFKKRYYSDFEFAWQRGAVWLSKLGDRVVRDFPVMAPSPYGKGVEPRIVWKSVESLLRLGVIVGALERCRAIILVRHPCGYVASQLRGESLGSFLQNDQTSEDYGVFSILLDSVHARRRGLTIEALKELEPIERFAWNWVLHHEIAFQDTEGVADCIRMRYENFCEEPVERARELFAFCELPWASETKAFIRASTSTHEDGYYSVFKDPHRAATRWKRELSAAQVARIYGVVRQSSLVELYPDDSPEVRSAIPST